MISLSDDRRLSLCRPKSCALGRCRGAGLFWRKFANSFLQVPALFPLVVSDTDFDDVLAGRRRPGLVAKARRLLEKTLWFWPRVVDARLWAEGAPDKPQTPLNYTTLDSSALALLEMVKAYAGDMDAEILDVGCNCGRHLNHLHGAGFSRLSGVDAMKSALELFASQFPASHAVVRAHHDLFQRFLAGQADKRYDLVYSHGATIELVHPSFDVVRHLCRITRRHIVLLLNEHEQAYPRFWITDFRRHGFYLAFALRPVGQVLEDEHHASLLVFQRMDQ